MLAGSSDRIVSDGSEEELEATLRKLNVLNNPQGELFKAEVLSKDVLEAGSAANSSCLSWSLCCSRGNADKDLDLAKFLCLLVITESLEFDGISKGRLVQLPCSEQGHPLLGQVTQSPIQPGLEVYPGTGLTPQFCATCGSASSPSL